MAWETLAIQGGIALGAFIISKFAARTPKPPQPQQLDLARTEEGAAIPTIYGTVRVDSPIIAWFGNPSAEAISSTGLFHYGCDLLFVLGTPPQQGDDTGSGLRGMYWGDKYISTMTGVSVPLLHENITLVGENIGGNGEGGVNIQAQFFDGRSDQLIVDGSYGPLSISSALGEAGIDLTLVPGYRYMMMVGARARTGSGRFGIGQSPNLPQIGFEVQSARELAIPGGSLDMNPARVIRDIVVHKLGRSVDETSFNAAITVLDDEEHGFSRVWYAGQSAEEMIREVCAQIDAIVYADPLDNFLIKIRLVRRDYDVEDLRVIDRDCAIAVPEVSGTTWNELPNQVIVTYTNREAHYQQGTARAQKLGSIFASGGRIRSVTFDHPGCCTKDLAERLAAKHLNEQGRPQLALKVKLNRRFYDVLPGEVLLADFPELNINETPMRVMEIDYGQLADGAISVSLLEDIFDNAEGAFPGGTVDPITYYLLPVHERLITEAPSWFQKRLYDAGVLTATSSDPMAYVFAHAVNPDDAFATSMKGRGTDIFAPTTLSDNRVSSSEWAKTAVLSTTYSRESEPYDTSEGIQIEDVTASFQTELDSLGATEWDDLLLSNYAHTLCVLYSPNTGDHEFIQYKRQSGTGSTRTLQYVWRGLLDTAPREWPAGTRVAFLGTSYGNPVTRPYPRFEGNTVEEQLVPLGSALVGSGDDPIDTVTIEMRQANPMPVTDLVIVGPDLEGVEGQPSISPKAFKRVTLFDGHASNAFANKQSRLATNIARGDEAGAAAAPETYALLGRKVDSEDGEVSLFTGLSNPGDASYFEVAKVGYGAIDLSMRTTDGDGRTSWTDPTIRVEAPVWRNLIVNSRGLNSTTTTPGTNGWTNVTGTVQSSQGTTSPSQSTTGTYFTSATASGGVTSFRQVRDVRGYKPAGLGAIVEFYYRNLSADSDDTTTVLVEAIASDGTTVLSSTTSGALVGETNLWTRGAADLALPDLTVFVRTTVTLTAAGGGDTTPSSALSEPTLVIGQFTEQILDNPTFDEDIEYLLSVRIDGEPEPVGENEEIAIDVEIEVGGDTQSNLILSLTFTYSIPYEAASSPTNVDLDGWTQTSAWSLSFGVYSATFERASLGVGAPASTLLFTLDSRDEGTVTLEAAVTSDEVVGSSTDMDVIDVEASWTVDATSGIAIPQNATEWTAVMAEAGIASGNPSALWLLQEASGNAADSIGSFTLTATAGSPALAYQQTITGWTTKGLGPSGDNSSGLLESTSASLPDVNTTSCLLLTYTLLEATPGGTREFTCLGTTIRMGARLNTTPRLQGNNGTNAATGGASPTGQVRPYVVQIDRANSITALYSDFEKVIPTWATTMTGKRVRIGGGGANAPQCKHLYAVLFTGAAAEMTATQIKTLLQTLGWTVSWTP